MSNVTQTYSTATTGTGAGSGVTYSAPTYYLGTTVTATVDGAGGQAHSFRLGRVGSNGGEVIGTVPFVATDTLTVCVGDNSGNGYHAGATMVHAGNGGGSSAVIKGGFLLIEAGGGGGQGWGKAAPDHWQIAPGAGGGGGQTAGSGGTGSAAVSGGSTANGGAGGIGTIGGSGGSTSPSAGGTSGAPGSNSGFGTGGAGGAGGGTYGLEGGGGGGGNSGGGGGGGGSDYDSLAIGGAGGGGAGGTSFAAGSVTSVTYNDNSWNSDVGQVAITARIADPPLQPTLNSPANNTTFYTNTTSTITFTWTYNPGIDSGSGQAAYSMVLIDPTSATHYYNASSQTLSGSVVWNTSSTTSVTIPMSVFSSQMGTWSWRVATEENGPYNLQGSYASPLGFTVSPALVTGMTISDSFSVSAMSPTILVEPSMAINDTFSVLFTYGQPNFSPGQLNSIGTPLPVFAQSLPYVSYHNVVGVQFASVQSPAVELIPNDRFQNTLHYETYQWNASTDWQPSGSAVLSFNAITNSVVVNHGAQAAITPGHSLVRPPVAPVLAEIAQGAGSQTQAGLLSPQVTPSTNGRLYAAVKVTPLTPLHSPLELQLLQGGATPTSQTVLNTWNITGSYNQQQVFVVGFNVGDFAPSGTNLQLQIVQANAGSTTDIWSVQALSLFDEGIFWQFSVDSGKTFYPGMAVRNSPYGVVQFPSPGNQLVWKATFYQPNLVLNEVEVRPLYQGSVAFLDQALGIKGATVEFNDIWASIYTDPLFNQTQGPIPRSWYSSPQPQPSS